MPDAGLSSNIHGFEDALVDVKGKAGPVTAIRLAATRKVNAGELGARQTDSVLIVGCNPQDKYMVGVAIMSVFGQVPQEHESSARKREEEMLKLVTRQTVAIEGIQAILRARLP